MTIDNFKNEIENFIRRMDSTNQRLEDIIIKLNAVSKINSKTIEYENIDIELLISNIIDDVKNDTNNQIDIILKGNKTFKSDRVLIYTIFHNILMNSFQHMDHRENKHIVSVDIRNNGNLLVKISDNGKGIEMKYTPKIFDLFYVANDKSTGNGLGLYQANLAAQRLKGEIRLINNKKPVIFEIYIRKPKNRIVHLSNKAAFI
jgi:signal transduction histidine kinase